MVFEIGLRSQIGVVYKANIIKIRGTDTIVCSQPDAMDKLMLRLEIIKPNFIKAISTGHTVEEVIINVDDIANLRVVG